MTTKSILDSQGSGKKENKNAPKIKNIHGTNMGGIRFLILSTKAYLGGFGSFFWSSPCGRKSHHPQLQTFWYFFPYWHSGTTNIASSKIPQFLLGKYASSFGVHVLLISSFTEVYKPRLHRLASKRPGTVDNAMLGCLIVDHAPGVEVLHQPILTEDLLGMKRTPTKKPSPKGNSPSNHPFSSASY